MLSTIFQYFETTVVNLLSRAPKITNALQRENFRALFRSVSDPAAAAARSAVDVRMAAVRHRLLVLSGKGGVGKSSVACGLAQAFAASGAKVGLVDVDVCGPSTARLMNVHGERVVDSPWGWKPLM